MANEYTTLLSFVVEAALGVWLGKILFFSFVGAPRTFEALPREDAGDVVNEIFPAYYLAGIGLGVLAFITGVVLGYLQGYGLVLGIVFFGSGSGVMLDIYARQVLSPRIRSSENFERHHRRSVVLNAATLVLVSVALAASHLYVNSV